MAKDFFVADSTSGTSLHARREFRLSSQGQLETSDGHAVQDQNGKADCSGQLQAYRIGPDGVDQPGRTEGGTNRGGRFQRSGCAGKARQQLFPGGSRQPSRRIRRRKPQVVQGQLEAANSQPAESAVQLVSVMRQFESLQKAMAIGTT